MILYFQVGVVFSNKGQSISGHVENLGAIVHNTEDNAEGRLAFREKRKPNFQGK